jgi:hypothetical protein
MALVTQWDRISQADLDRHGRVALGCDDEAAPIGAALVEEGDECLELGHRL